MKWARVEIAPIAIIVYRDELNRITEAEVRRWRMYLIVTSHGTGE